MPPIELLTTRQRTNLAQTRERRFCREALVKFRFGHGPRYIALKVLSIELQVATQVSKVDGD